MLLKNSSVLYGKDLMFVSSTNLKISEQIIKKIKPNGENSIAIKKTAGKRNNKRINARNKNIGASNNFNIMFYILILSQKYLTLKLLSNYNKNLTNFFRT